MTVNYPNETELLLMFSARSELVNKIILDNKSDYLLLDRFLMLLWPIKVMDVNYQKNL
ncbi:MAG: hypothetical protein CM15mP108_0620 [Gammaproteobacteria bacterium]|nr:MAG: hypothetical protein CM15mP108_0620 [Gammaproteobacteria bacterium]